MSNIIKIHNLYLSKDKNNLELAKQLCIGLMGNSNFITALDNLSLKCTVEIHKSDKNYLSKDELNIVITKIYQEQYYVGKAGYNKYGVYYKDYGCKSKRIQSIFISEKELIKAFKTGNVNTWSSYGFSLFKKAVNRFEQTSYYKASTDTVYYNLYHNDKSHQIENYRLDLDTAFNKLSTKLNVLINY